MPIDQRNISKTTKICFETRTETTIQIKWDKKAETNAPQRVSIVFIKSLWDRGNKHVWNRQTGSITFVCGLVNSLHAYI